MSHITVRRQITCAVGHSSCANPHDDTLQAMLTVLSTLNMPSAMTPQTRGARTRRARIGAPNLTKSEDQRTYCDHSRAPRVV